MVDLRLNSSSKTYTVIVEEASLVYIYTKLVCTINCYLAAII